MPWEEAYLRLQNLSSPINTKSQGGLHSTPAKGTAILESPPPWSPSSLEPSTTRRSHPSPLLDLKGGLKFSCFYALNLLVSLITINSWITATTITIRCFFRRHHRYYYITRSFPQVPFRLRGNCVLTSSPSKYDL